jgi:hypothetical protein
MANHRRVLLAATAFVLLGTTVAVPLAHAGTLDGIGEPIFDPPTQSTLGVRLPVPADLNPGATVAVRYRPAGTADWHDALPLHRVYKEHVPEAQREKVNPEFGGSVFGLQPGTGYDVDLVVDDGAGTTTTVHASAATRPMPAFPATPAANWVRPGDGQQLQDALDHAGPGTVIELDTNVYSRSGNFTITSDHDGTVDNPVVIRPALGAAPVLHGVEDLYTGRPVLTVLANHVHVYGLTVENGQRGILFADHTNADGSVTPNEGAAVQRTTVRTVHYGIATGDRYGMNGAYICDNDLTGVMPPLWFYNDGHNTDPPGRPAASPDWDGIMVGSGSMVCHNTIQGFGDAMIVYNGPDSTLLPRGIDFVANDVRWTYDNGVETDHSYSNVRVYRNRFLNTFAPLSFQPVFGGPVYAFRNVIVNAKDDPLKLHGDGDNRLGPTGVLIYNNTIDRAGAPLTVNALAATNDSEVENNLFVGSSADQSANWFAPIDPATTAFDFNGYEPDGYYWFGHRDDGRPYKYYKLDGPGDGAVPSVHTGGLFEPHGQALGTDVFTRLQPWPAWEQQVPTTASAALSPTAKARDAGRPLPGVNDVPDGRPDLGAMEFDCRAPWYGVRPFGSDDVILPGLDGPGAEDPCGDPPPSTTAVVWRGLHNAVVDGTTLRWSGDSGDGYAFSQRHIADSTLLGWANAVNFSWPQQPGGGCVGLADTTLTTCASMRYRLELAPDGSGTTVRAMDGQQQLGQVTVDTAVPLQIALINGQVWFGAGGHRFGVAAAPVLNSAPAVGAVLQSPTAAVADATITRIADMNLS